MLVFAIAPQSKKGAILVLVIGKAGTAPRTCVEENSGN
jgi:hypothetical protein